MDVFNSLLSFLLMISFVSGVQQDNKTDPTYGDVLKKTDNITRPICVDDFKTPTKEKINRSEVENICNSRRCITKCCLGLNRFFFVNLRDPDTTCLDHSQLVDQFNKTVVIDYSVDVFEGNSEEDANLVKRNLTECHIVHNSKLSKNNCSSPILLEPESYFIYGNGSLVSVRFNYYKIFVKHWDFGNFCYEHTLVMDKDGSFREPFVQYIRFEPKYNNDKIDEESGDDHKIITLILSCLCLLIVLIVYGLIPELRNLNGMVLITYVSTLFITFILRLVMILGNQDKILEPPDCKVLSLIVYYFALSAFFWMNIMSLDIWWSFKGMYKARAIHRSGEGVKFCWYALYAWGTPLLVSIAVGYIDYADLTHRPHFFKPHFEHCIYMNVAHGIIEIRYYLYMPILALLMLNLVFFLMTAYNIWRIKRDIGRFPNKTKYNNNSNRFGVYIKLSLVMGISWIFETLTMPSWLQLVAAIYNGLTGVAIFLIFIFKWNILEKLCKRLDIKTEFIEKMRRKSSMETKLFRRKSSTEKTTMADFNMKPEKKLISTQETSVSVKE